MEIRRRDRASRRPSRPRSSAQVSSAPGTLGTTEPAPPVASPFAGIEQQGIALGSPDAPVTLVEYADLQCPYCAQWSRETLPVLLQEYVASGKLRIVFHGLAFIGSDSDKALRTAIAAGEHDHLWDVVHGLYAGQGAENAGWVTDELVSEIAAGVPGLDGATLLSARWEDTVDSEMKHAADAATARRCAQHSGLPDRADRRPARARRGQLARARRHPPGDRGGAGTMSEGAPPARQVP